jgi:hypothetical protein
MKDQMLKIAKVKSEKEFYKKYPSEEAFMKAHGKAFKKAAMGAKMVNDQLHQLSDFGNPPVAEVGTMIGGNPVADKQNKPFSLVDITKDVNATNAGITRQQYDKNQQQAEDRKNAEIAAAGNKGGGIGDLLNLGVDLMGKFGGAGGGDKTGKTGVGGIPPEIQDAISAGFEMRHGGNVYKYQDGGMANIANMIGGAFDKKGGLGSGIADMFNIGGGSGKISNVGPSGALMKGAINPATGVAADSAGFAAGAEAAGLGVLNAAPQILQGFGQMNQQKANIAKANQFAQISGLTAQAAESQPEFKQRRYVRPEDSLVQPGQMGSPQGVGTNYLAQNGRSIGGNPTEIQNTYAPGNLYGDLGYEPLNDSNPKQYAHGGYLHKAAFGDYFQDSGQASVGKGVGSAIGTAFFGPLGGKVGGLLGTVAGNALGGADDATRLKGYQDVGAANIDRAAWAQGANAIRAQNSTFMKDGGYTDSEHAWMSNGWQPQVITKFGEHDVKDLLKPPHDADMLRAGGHLREYTPPSAEAMYTGRGQYAMGGELKTHWGGKAETMSHNPYLPDGGETVMFRGQSHDETDGNGKSGIGVTYGDSPVEVERGEPAVKLQDGGNPGEDNLVVFGNMVIPDYGVKELEDKNAKGKKFKHYVADLSKQEAKHNKTIERATEIVNDSDGSNPFEQLSFNSGKAMLMGSNLKLKNIADKKQRAAMVQNAILDTAAEFGVESDGLSKGKLKAIKDPAIGRDGKKLKKAQSGWHPEWGNAQDSTIPYEGIPMSNASTNPPTYAPFTVPSIGFEQSKSNVPYLPTNGIANLPGDLPIVTVGGSRNQKRISPIAPLAPQSIDPSKIPNIEMAKADRKGKKGKTDWKSIADAALSMYPYGRPTNQMPLDPSQLAGEMYALGNNQLEGVQAQTFQPMLDTPYDISLQDQLNAIDSQSRAAIRASGQDPAAQAYIMSQAADQKNKVLGEQFRFNQANKAQVYQANRQALNQAQLQNLGILDKQYERQATAKSKTKAQTIAALSSISDKIAKNKLENRKLGLYENLYGFRFDDKGRAYNINNPAQFDMSGSGGGGGYSNSMLPANKRFTIDPVTKKIAGIMTLTKDEMAGGDSALSAASALGLLDDDTQKNGGKTKKSKNGSIVKAIKNL